MKTIIISQLLICAFSILQSQSLQGKCFITASTGDINLNLSSNDGMNYSGKMIGAGVSGLSITEKKNSAQEIMGKISDNRNKLGFGASLINNQLRVSLMPPDLNGAPIFNQTQYFIMKLKNKKEISANKQGGSLTALNSKNSSAWDGTYYGDINGTTATLTLDQQGQTVSGKIDAGGYIYNISGSLSNDQFTGQLSDPQTQGKMACDGSMQNDQVSLTIKDYNSGQLYTLVFSKNKSNTSVHPKSNSAGIERDPNLIGNWLYSNSYTSGDFGFTTQYRLIINLDGSYLYGDAKMAGGGPASSVSSEGGGYTKGQWKTQNKTIYINEGSGWQAYAGYYVEGNSMLMKFSDGSKQVWERY